MNAPRWLRVTLKRLTYGGVGRGRDGERVVAWLDVRPGTRVADIGAGFGDFAIRLARATGPTGIVYAVDVDPDLREEVGRKARREGLPQLRPLEALSDDPALPEVVDLIFLSSSFHHLPDPGAYLERVRAYLREGGSVAILEDTPGRTSGLFGHATPPETVRSTLEAAGYRLLATSDLVRSASLQTFEPICAPDAPAPGPDWTLSRASGSRAPGGPSARA